MKRMFDRKELEPTKYYVRADYDGDFDEWLLEAGSNLEGYTAEPFTWSWENETPPDVIIFTDSASGEYCVYPTFASYDSVLRYTSHLMFSEDDNPCFIEVIIDLEEKSAMPAGRVVQLQLGE